jgi:phosphate transport system ATP-binding protein
VPHGIFEGLGLHPQDLIRELAERYTIVLVTHNMEQARRIADRTAFFYLGDLVEIAPTVELFEDPKDKRTQRYMCFHLG